MIHTGQHFDDDLSGQFLGELGLGAPSLHLEVGGRRARHPDRRRHPLARGSTSTPTRPRWSWCTATRTPRWPAPSPPTPAASRSSTWSRAAQLRPGHARGAQPHRRRPPGRPVPRADGDQPGQPGRRGHRRRQGDPHRQHRGRRRARPPAAGAGAACRPRPARAGARRATCCRTFHRPENVDDPEVLGDHPVRARLAAICRSSCPCIPAPGPRSRTFGLSTASSQAAPGPDAHRLPRVPGPGGRVGAPRVGLGRRAGGGQRRQATGAGGPELHRAARDPGHVRAARPPGPAGRRLDRAAAGSGPAAARPAGRTALAVRRRHGIAAILRRDHDAPLPADLVEARRVP